MNLVEQFKKRKNLSANVTFEFQSAKFTAARINQVIKSEAISHAQALLAKYGIEDDNTRLNVEMHRHLFEYLVNEVVDWEMEGLDYSRKVAKEFFEGFNYDQRVLFALAYTQAEVSDSVGKSQETGTTDSKEGSSSTSEVQA